MLRNRVKDLEHKIQRLERALKNQGIDPDLNYQHDKRTSFLNENLKEVTQVLSALLNKLNFRKNFVFKQERVEIIENKNDSI